MELEPIQNYLITPHAAFEMERRGLSEQTVAQILKNPEQRIELRSDRVVLQSRIDMVESGNTYLVRIFVDIHLDPPEVVTAYKTSKISKYWKERP